MHATQYQTADKTRAGLAYRVSRLMNKTRQPQDFITAERLLYQLRRQVTGSAGPPVEREIRIPPIAAGRSIGPTAFERAMDRLLDDLEAEVEAPPAVRRDGGRCKADLGRPGRRHK